MDTCVLCAPFALPVAARRVLRLAPLALFLLAVLLHASADLLSSFVTEFSGFPPRLGEVRSGRAVVVVRHTEIEQSGSYRDAHGLS